MQGLVYRVLSAPDPKVPEPVAPSWENVRVSIREMRPVTEEEILAELDALRLDAAIRTSRAPGEPVEAWDEVLVDSLAYAKGKLVPFSPQEDMRFPLDAKALAEPVLAALVGAPVGASGRVLGTLAADHAIEALRNQPAVYAFDVKAAWSRVALAPDDPDLLVKLGLDADPERSMMGIRIALEKRRREAQEREIVQQMMAELTRRTQVEVSKALIQKETLFRWTRKEGRYLQRLGVQAEDYDAAFDAWLRDPETAADVRKALSNALILRSIARKMNLQFDKVALRHEAAILASELGVGKATVIEEQLASGDRGVSEVLVSQVASMELLTRLRLQVKVDVKPLPTSG